MIETRRDPLETTWSCFKQQFCSQPHFANTLADLGAYLRGCERAMDAWRARDPDRIRLHRYEALLANPEAGVHRLLAECRLDHDPACLDFHAVRRSVRTASAAQVRQPLAPRYCARGRVWRLAGSVAPRAGPALCLTRAPASRIIDF